MRGATNRITRAASARPQSKRRRVDPSVLDRAKRRRIPERSRTDREVGLRRATSREVIISRLRLTIGLSALLFLTGADGNAPRAQTAKMTPALKELATAADKEG